MSTPKIPPAEKIPQPPQPIDDNVLAARRRERTRQLAAYMRGSTVLTGPKGAPGKPSLGTPSLLGQG